MENDGAALNQQQMINWQNELDKAAEAIITPECQALINNQVFFESKFHTIFLVLSGTFRTAKENSTDSCRTMAIQFDC
jgi:hypothetical protein